MSREIRTEIVIQAAAERVWAILLDFPSYPQWNPFVREVAGAPVPGRRLTIRLQRSETSTVRFRPTVVVASPARELRWRGRLGIPGLFDGEHTFAIEPRADGGAVRFVQSERFSGLLVPLIWRSLEPSTRAGFLQMNEALRARAELPADRVPR